MGTIRLGAACAGMISLCAAAMPSVASADTDACKLLTPAQIARAVGTPVAAGKHVTPTFVRTCTWVASGNAQIKYVTLYLQTAANFDGGKRMAAQMAALGKGAAMKPGHVGEDSYYFVAGSQVGLLVKKGRVSFKVAVYATLPVGKKEAMELALAKETLRRL